MPDQPNNSLNRPVTDENEEGGAFSMDTVVYALKRFWYLVILCALAGGGAAYYHAGRQHYVYSKTASVMMRDAGQGVDSSSQRILTELGADTGAANLSNESYILKSTALMQRVAETLALHTTYWSASGLREIELYNKTPLLAVFAGLDDARACEVRVLVSDNDTFTLTYPNRAGDPISIPGTYAQPVQLPFGEITIHPTASMSPEWANREVVIRHVPVLQEARNLLASLTVTRPDLKDASTLELTLTANNPQKAEDVLNNLIEAYNQHSRDEKSESARKTEAFIKGRLVDLGRSLEEVDRQISASKAEGDILTDTQSTITSDLGSSNTLEQQIFDLQTQITLAATLGEQLDESARKDGLISIGAGIMDAAISTKIEAYNEAYLEWRKISSSAGPRNPIAAAHKEQMSATLTAARRALDNYRSNLNLKLKELQDKQEELKERLTATVHKEQELTPLIREHKVKEELYMLLLTKEQENALALAIAEPSARVLEKAHGSDAPIAPKTTMYVAGGALGGGALCLFIIIGLGMLNRKVNTRQDISPNSKVPTIGELPILSRRDHPSGLLLQNAHSTMAECLHILRNNIENMLPREEGRGHILLLTSSMPGEGKTFTAANLAATYAQAGRRVLLIDADLRKTSLTRELGGKGRHGLTTLLLHHCSDPTELIHPLPGTEPNAPGKDGETGQTGPSLTCADILYAGPTTPTPVTLLAQPLLGEILKKLSAQYDAIIIDAPPYGILADTDILAAEADICLYLIRAGRIDKRYLPQIQKLAETGKLPHAAYILNGVNFKASSYKYYGYGYGHYRYGYSGDSKKKP